MRRASDKDHLKEKENRKTKEKRKRKTREKKERTIRNPGIQENDEKKDGRRAKYEGQSTKNEVPHSVLRS
jgi:hypothetical protein